MNEARAKRILDELQKQGVSQMLLTDPMSIYYLTGVSMAPIERFYALLLRAEGLKGPVSASAYGDERSGRFCECFCSGGYYPRCEGC